MNGNSKIVILNMTTSAGIVRDAYVRCLTQQLGELDLLKSMYPNNNDIVLTNTKSLTEIQNFLENATEYTPNHLDFTLNLFLRNMKLELCINLPGLYPEQEPNIYIRCNQLNRHQESQLNAELSNYIKNNHIGEVCLYTAICWLQENIDDHISKKNKDQNIVNEETTDSNIQKEKYVRLWIYCHHIYNKKKREEIVKKAKELELSGFCLSGKPGIICVEGRDSDCYDWWKDIKSMNWKKIFIRKTEEFDLPEPKFINFEEITLNMSDFSKYMDQHGLNQSFNEVFGLSN